MEIWKDIQGYEGHYKVSNLGNVVSVKKGYPVLMKLQNHSSGYKQVKLCKPNKILIERVHRLVASAFIPNHDKKTQVNHINGIKCDNRVDNLEWSTPQENTRHAFRTGLANVYGENHHHSKLSDKEAEYIIKNYKSYTLKQLSNKFGVSDACIRDIIKGRRRKTLKGNQLNNLDITSFHIVLNVETGVYYYSCVEAANSFNMNPENLRRRLTGEYKRNETSFRLV